MNTTKRTKKTQDGTNYNAIASSFVKAVTADDLDPFAVLFNSTETELRRLGVGVATADELVRLGAKGVQWRSESDRLLVVPMRDAAMGVVGLWACDEDGRPGVAGELGLIFPLDLAKCPDPILVVGGLKDLTACLRLGLTAVGCPVKKPAVADVGRLVKGRDAIMIAASGGNEWRLGALASLGMAISWKPGSRPSQWVLDADGVSDRAIRRHGKKLLALIREGVDG